MADPDKELWVDLYRMAMMELENAKIAGRIGDARIEIAVRLAKLREIPGLHTVEKQAIDDAMSALQGLNAPKSATLTMNAVSRKRLCKIFE